MAYEDTLVAVSKSQEQIRRMIMDNGGSGIAFISQPPMEGFEAMVVIDGSTYKIRLSVEVKVPERKRAPRAVWNGTGYVTKSKNDIWDAAARRVWRVLYYYLKSVYEASNSGVMELRQLVMPYVVTRDNRTVAEHILPKLKLAVEGDPGRMLPMSVER